MSECKNISICKFLLAYESEKQYWFYKYCGNDHLAKKCERLRWCSCKGTSAPPINYQPDGRKHK